MHVRDFAQHGHERLPHRMTTTMVMGSGQDIKHEIEMEVGGDGDGLEPAFHRAQRE